MFKRMKFVRELSLYRKSNLQKSICNDGMDIRKFLKKIYMLKVIYSIILAQDQILSEMIRQLRGKLLRTENDSVDNAVVPIALMNKDFIEQFSPLNIAGNEAEINEWFNADGPRYELINDQGIVETITVPENIEDEGEDNVIVHVKDQKFQCPI